MSTLSDPIDSSPPGSSIHGIFQARVLEWVATAFWRVYFHSCFKVALSITAVPPVPYLSLGSLPVLLLPCPALCFWPKLLGRCLCGSFYVLAICVGFPHLPELTLCVAGLCAFDSQFQWSTLCIAGIVCTCLSSLGVHSASRGLCRLVSAPWASILRHWASVALFRLTVPTLYVAGFMCTCFLSLPTFSVSGVICSSFSCTRKFVCTAQVCMLHLYLNPSPALCTGCACRSTPGYLGPPSVLQGLCTMAEFVCLATLSFLSPRSVGGHIPISC